MISIERSLKDNVTNPQPLHLKTKEVEREDNFIQIDDGTEVVEPPNDVRLASDSIPSSPDREPAPIGSEIRRSKRIRTVPKWYGINDHVV